MVFLGKIALQSGGKRLGVKGDGTLAMLPLSSGDPAGQFLAYDVGNGHFSLQAHTGGWVNFYAAKSDIAWYPVLYSANTFGRSQFAMQYFDMPNRRLKFAFTASGDPMGAAATTFYVALEVTTGTTPYCRCEFDVANGWTLGRNFTIEVFAPGVPEIQQSKSAVGYNFSCLGNACVNLSNVTFNGVNFQDTRLEGVRLNGTNFENCNLTRTIFKNADLTSTNFSMSSVAGCDFSSCDLTKGAIFPASPFASSAPLRVLMRNAKVPAATLGKNWSFIDLTSAEIVGIKEANLEGLVARYCIATDLNFSNKALQNADFSHSDLTRCSFQESKLQSAKFHAGVLSECLFTRADLIKARFDPDPANLGLGSTDLVGAKFSGAALYGASFQMALLWKSVFTGADLEDADFTSAQLGGADRSVAASLSYAYMANVKLDKANLFGVSMTYVSLFGAAASITQTATMEQADFSNAYLSGIDLSEANLKGAKFSGACLVNVRLNNVDLQPAASGSVISSLSGAALQGAIFTGAKLNHADLSNAAVAFTNSDIPVRYCDAHRQAFPPPPSTMPLRFQATVGLDESTIGMETKCPNGLTYRENVAAGNTLQQMLTSSNAPPSWYPKSCGPA